jgi:membrane protein implicated in regulation of membrane protease activity
MSTTAKTAWLTAAFLIVFAIMASLKMPIDFILALFAISVILLPYFASKIRKTHTIKHSLDRFGKE